VKQLKKKDYFEEVKKQLEEKRRLEKEVMEGLRWDIFDDDDFLKDD
jgi:hypothetical protein